MKRILRPLLLLAVIGGGIYYWYTHRAPAEIVLTGIVTTQEVVVSPQIAGRIDKLLVNEGDTVKADQMIAVLEPDELRQEQAFYTHTAAGAGSQVAESEAAVRLEERQMSDQIAQAEAMLASTESQRAARSGEFVNAGQPVVTIVNPDDLWVRADVEETYIDRIKVGDKLRVRLPSGEEREGTLFFRGVDASFATQRDVSRTKRDIKTFEIRLRVDNTDRHLAVGMTAYVLLPTM